MVMFFQGNQALLFIQASLVLLVFLCSLWLLPARAFADTEGQIYSNWAAVNNDLVWNDKNVYFHMAGHTHVFKGFADPFSLLPDCLEPLLIHFLLSYLGGKWFYDAISRVMSVVNGLSKISERRKYEDTEYTVVPLMKLPQVLSRRLLIQFDRTEPGWEIYPVPVNPVSKEHLQQLSPYLQALYRLWETLRATEVSTLKIHVRVDAANPETVIETERLPPVVVPVSCGQPSLESYLAAKRPEPSLATYLTPRAWLFSKQKSPAGFTCTLLETEYLNLVADILKCVADQQCRAEKFEKANDRYRYHGSIPDEFAHKPELQTLVGEYLDASEVSDDSEWLIRIKDPDGWVEPGREVLIYQNGQTPDEILAQLDDNGHAWTLRQMPDFTIVPRAMGVQLVTTLLGYMHKLWSEGLINLDQPAYREEDLSRALVPLDIDSAQDWEFKSPLAKEWPYGERSSEGNYFETHNPESDVVGFNFLPFPVQSKASSQSQELVPVGARELRRWLAISPLASEFRAAVLPGWIEAHLAIEEPVQAPGTPSPPPTASGFSGSPSEASDSSAEGNNNASDNDDDSNSSFTGDGNENPEDDRWMLTDSEILKTTAGHKRKPPNVPSASKFSRIRPLSVDGEKNTSPELERVRVNSGTANDGNDASAFLTDIRSVMTAMGFTHHEIPADYDSYYNCIATMLNIHATISGQPAHWSALVVREQLLAYLLENYSGHSSYISKLLGKRTREIMTLLEHINPQGYNGNSGNLASTDMGGEFLNYAVQLKFGIGIKMHYQEDHYRFRDYFSDDTFIKFRREARKLKLDLAGDRGLKMHITKQNGYYTLWTDKRTWQKYQASLSDQQQELSLVVSIPLRPTKTVAIQTDETMESILTLSALEQGLSDIASSLGFLTAEYNSELLVDLHSRVSDMQQRFTDLVLNSETLIANNVSAWIERNRQLTNQLRKLELNFIKSEIQLTEANEEAKWLLTELGDTRKKTDEARETINQLEEDRKEKDERIASLTEELHQLQSDLTSSQSEKRRSSQKLRSAEKNKEELEKQVSLLQQKIADLEDKYEKEKQEKVNLKNEQMDRGRKIDQMMGKLNQLNVQFTENKKLLENAEETHKKEAEELKRQKVLAESKLEQHKESESQLQLKVQQLEEDNQRFLKELSEKDKLFHEKIAQWNLKSDHFNDQLGKLNSVINNQGQTIASLHKNDHQLMEWLVRAEEIISHLQQNLGIRQGDNLLTSSSVTVRVTGVLEGLQRVDVILRRLPQLTQWSCEAAQALHQHREEYHRQRHWINTLKQNLQTVNENQRQLQGELQAEQTSRSRAEEKVRNLLRQLTAEQQKLSDLSNELDAATDRIIQRHLEYEAETQEKSRKILLLQKQLESLENTIEKQLTAPKKSKTNVAKAKRLSKEISAKAFQVTSLETDLAKHEEILTGIERELEETKKKLETNDRKLEDIKKELETSERELKGTKTKLETNERELKETKTKLETNERELKETKRELAHGKRKSKKNKLKQKSKLAEMKRRLSDKDQEYQKASDELIEQHRTKVQAIESQNNKLDEQVAKLQEELRVVEQRASETQKRLEASTNKLSLSEDREIRLDNEVNRMLEILENQEEAARLASQKADERENNLQREKELALTKGSELEERVKELEKLLDQERLQTEQQRKNYEQQLSVKGDQINGLTEKNQDLVRQYQQEREQAETTAASMEQDFAGEQEDMVRSPSETPFLDSDSDAPIPIKRAASRVSSVNKIRRLISPPSSDTGSDDDENNLSPDDSSEPEFEGFVHEVETIHSKLQPLVTWAKGRAIDSDYEQALAHYALRHKWLEVVTQEFNQQKLPVPVYKGGAFAKASRWSSAHINYLLWKHSSIVPEVEQQLSANLSLRSEKNILKQMKSDHKDYVTILNQHLRKALGFKNTPEIPWNRELSMRMSREAFRFKESGFQLPAVLRQDSPKNQQWNIDCIRKLLKMDGLVFISHDGGPGKMRVPGLVEQVADSEPSSPEYNSAFYRLMQTYSFHFHNLASNLNMRSKESPKKQIRLPHVDGLNFSETKLDKAALTLWLVYYRGHFEDLRQDQVVSRTALEALRLITNRIRHKTLSEQFLSLAWHYAFAGKNIDIAEQQLKKNAERNGIGMPLSIEEIRKLRKSLPEVKFKDKTLKPDGSINTNSAF